MFQKQSKHLIRARCGIHIVVYFSMQEDGNDGTSGSSQAGGSGSSGSGQDVIQVLLAAIRGSQAEMRNLREEVRAAQEEAAGRQP